MVLYVRCMLIILEFVNHVDAIGVIFDEDTDLGQFKYCPITTPGDEQTIDKFSSLDLNHLSVIQQKQLLFQLCKFDHVSSDKLGLCKIIQHSIRLVEGFESKPTHLYHIPDKLKAEVDRQVAELLSEGKIRRSKSPYAHPIVCVSKQMAV